MRLRGLPGEKLMVNMDMVKLSYCSLKGFRHLNVASAMIIVPRTITDARMGLFLIRVIILSNRVFWFDMALIHYI